MSLDPTPPVPAIGTGSGVIHRLVRAFRTEDARFLPVAVLLGIGTALCVHAFKSGYYELNHALYDSPLGRSGVGCLLLPTLGGLIVGLFVKRILPPEPLHGTAAVMESVSRSGGRLPYARMPAKAVAAGMSIGVGASVGPEDPSVQIGANLGSCLGQWLRLSSERVVDMVGAGVASGVSAAFNTPIAGLFFTIEIIHGHGSRRSNVGVLALASVASAVTTRLLVGEQPAFAVPTVVPHSPVDLPAYLGLGVVAGLVALGFVKVFDLMHRTLHRARAPLWARTALAGLAVGLVALAVPAVRGVGYSSIQALLEGDAPPLTLLLGLFLGKLVLTPLCLAWGFPGGVFAPTLVVGAALGGLYGHIWTALFPGHSPGVAILALIGMATVLASTMHAPLTAVLLTFELTSDAQLLLPVLLAVSVSYLLALGMGGQSIYDRNLERAGVRLVAGLDVDLLDTIHVREVMSPMPLTLAPSDSLETAFSRLRAARSGALPVVDARNVPVGILTHRDLDLDVASAGALIRVADACSLDPVVVPIDATIATALRKMAPRGLRRLPVVAHADPPVLVGILESEQISNAYQLALTRRARPANTESG